MPMTLAVVRLEASAAIPNWGMKGSDFFSITRTRDELSVVCLEEDVPEGVKVEKGWRGFKVEGPLDFGMTGVLYSLAKPLAEAKISIFAISTFDTDYLLVKKENLQKAAEVLSAFCKVT